MSVDEYECNIFELKQYAGIVGDESMIIQHFVRGLSDRISGEVHMHEPKTLEATVEKARLVEENHTLAIGGVVGGRIVNVPVTGSVVRGSQQ